jgi:hypothetical protein
MENSCHEKQLYSFQGKARDATTFNDWWKSFPPKAFNEIAVKITVDLKSRADEIIYDDSGGIEKLRIGTTWLFFHGENHVGEGGRIIRRHDPLIISYKRIECFIKYRLGIIGSDLGMKKLNVIAVWLGYENYDQFRKACDC